MNLHFRNYRYYYHYKERKKEKHIANGNLMHQLFCISDQSSEKEGIQITTNLLGYLFDVLYRC